MIILWKQWKYSVFFTRIRKLRDNLEHLLTPVSAHGLASNLLCESAIFDLRSQIVINNISTYLIIEKIKRPRLCDNDVILTTAILKRWNNWNGSSPRFLTGTSASIVQSFIEFDPHVFTWKENKNTSESVSDRHTNRQKSIYKASFGLSSEWDVKICKRFTYRSSTRTKKSAEAGVLDVELPTKPGRTVL